MNTTLFIIFSIVALLVIVGIILFATGTVALPIKLTLPKLMKLTGSKDPEVPSNTPIQETKEEEEKKKKKIKLPPVEPTYYHASKIPDERKKPKFAKPHFLRARGHHFF